MSLDIGLCFLVDTGGIKPVRLDIGSRSISYNYDVMWRAAGIYEALYDSNGELAEKYLEIVKSGREEMNNNPTPFQAMENKSHNVYYEVALDFLDWWIELCEKNPKAIIWSW